MMGRRSRGLPRVVLVRGFSLLEVLVAFSLMAMTLGVLFQVFSGGLRLATQSEEYSVALRLAENRLNETAANDSLEAGDARGTFDFKDYQWRQSVEPYVWADSGAMQAAPFKAYFVRVEVLWGEKRSRSVSLATLHLIPRQ